MTQAALRAVGLVLLIPIVGCAPPQPPATPAATPARDDLRIGLTEWSIETGPVQATSGDVRLRVFNAGATTHDLVITGALGSWATPVLSPGQQHELHIQTVAGEQLQLVCTLTGHHSQGMHTKLAVEAAA